MNVNHHILNMKFGKSIVVDLKNRRFARNDGQEIFVFLPKRWDVVLIEEQLSSMKPSMRTIASSDRTHPIGNENVAFNWK